MKKSMRFLTCLVAFLLTVNGAAFFCSAQKAETAETFTPVLRFLAASDTHVREESDMTAERIGKMLRLGYEAAERDPSFKQLDAVLIAGDLTHVGTKAAFEKFRDAVFGSLKDGTRFLGVVAKNHDGYTLRRAEMRDLYSSLTGNDADFHVVLNGYHFIGISASPTDGVHYDKGQLKWLKQQLDAAVAEDPNKPVFVMHHEHVRNTVYGSSAYDTWGVTYFTSILRQYPQVVDFSGHSHYPLNDPRSIWQGAFTAIGTGAIAYTEVTIGLDRAYDPPDAYEVGTFWIVEVDAANRIRLRGMDVDAGKPLCEAILDNPADRANRAYTPANQRAASKAPVFPEGAALSMHKQDGKYMLQIPVAQSTDGKPVVLYRVYARNKLGMTVSRDWSLPQYYRINDQQTVEHLLRGVPAGNQTIRVVAETAYGVQSDALEMQVQVDAYLCPHCGQTHTGVSGFFTALYHRLVDIYQKVA